MLAKKATLSGNALVHLYPSLLANESFKFCCILLYFAGERLYRLAFY